MKTKYLFMVLLLCISMASAGDFVLVAEYTEIRGFISTDRLGNIYAIENGVLKRFDSQSKITTYSNRHFGMVTHADVSDPLHIIVFFQDFGTIVTLDRNLSEKNVFLSNDLQDTDIPYLVCSSVRGGYWVYFPVSSSLKRFNEWGKSDITSNDILREHPEFIAPRYMVERDEKLYLSGSGLWVFDLYATYLFRLPEISPGKFQVVDNKIFFVEDALLGVYDMVLNSMKKIPLPEENILSFFLHDDGVFLQTDVSLKKFRYKGKF